MIRATLAAVPQRRLLLAAFAASPASQAHPSPKTVPPPPPNYRGSWPPRRASESFISPGLFAGIVRNRPRACLSGIVLNGARHVNGLTGQALNVAAVRTAGFEAGLCMAASRHPGMPLPGNSISGTVFLSAAIDRPLLDGTSA